MAKKKPKHTQKIFEEKQYYDQINQVIVPPLLVKSSESVLTAVVSLIVYLTSNLISLIVLITLKKRVPKYAT